MNALIVVAKRPASGRTKTRLTPPLSPDQAAALYECFLRDTLDLVRRVPNVRPVIAYLPRGQKRTLLNSRRSSIGSSRPATISARGSITR